MDYSFFINIVLFIHFILLIIIALRILARDDLTSPARLSWLVVLFLLPYLGVVIYWLFGEVHLGPEFAKKHQQIIDTLHSQHSEVLGKHDGMLNQAINPEYQAAFAYSAAVTGYFPVAGNSAILMKDADDTRKHMIADFDAATDHIHVLYYIWLEDDMGVATAEALIRAAKRGVTCRAMVDGLGSRKFVHSKTWQRMKDAGVQVSVALPFTNFIKVILFSRIDLRNHRKITVIDGRIAYCGSRNCADPEFREKPKYAPWIDIMLRVEGPIVAQNQLLFASDWLMFNADTPLDSFYYDTTKIHGGFVAQVFADGPTQKRATSPQFLGALISQAQDSLTISTPYFVPDYSLVSILCATAQRGVKVTMIFPKNNDSFVVAATSRSHYFQLLDAGVKIFEYNPRLLHAKTLTVDGQISLIGSTNLDLRSFDLNYENNILIYDQKITQDIIERQADYIADSDEITFEEVKNWSLPHRIWNNIVATMGPIL
ncbi:cardiolipin synthase [Psychrobacter ciconiae]|uniref:cardiolipin synthase n=1 Tax=Psychrobacter ciconiae TaxID=1553449 RepID=UPI00191B6891|nr:cardiolipin synthase [Psychrobacter ciconiae]